MNTRPAGRTSHASPLVDTGQRPGDATGHSGKKVHVCTHPECQKRFAFKTDWRRHLLRHTDTRPHVCTEPGCQKRFTLKTDWQRHRLRHTSTKPHLCPEDGCQKRFALKADWRRHRLRHSNTKPYICPEDGCHKRFGLKADWRRHRLIHTGTRTHICPVESCQKRFLMPGDWRRHLDTHRRQIPALPPPQGSGAGPGLPDGVLAAPGTGHPCPEPGCGRYFARPGNLRLHLSRHSDETPGSCPLSECAKRCALKGRRAPCLRTHAREQPGILPVDPHTSPFPPLSHDVLDWLAQQTAPAAPVDKHSGLLFSPDEPFERWMQPASFPPQVPQPGRALAGSDRPIPTVDNKVLPPDGPLLS